MLWLVLGLVCLVCLLPAAKDPAVQIVPGGAWTGLKAYYLASAPTHTQPITIAIASCDQEGKGLEDRGMLYDEMVINAISS